MNWQAPALAVLLACACWRADAGVVEFLYVNANEGTASGGHVALKLDGEVFHFQHVPPGLLRIQRDDFARFRLEYGERENRTIRLHRLEVPDGVFQRLRGRFSRLLLVENEQFERRDGLEHDRRLLEALLRQAQGGAETLAVKGAGLFLADGWNPADAAQPAAAVKLNESGAAILILAETPSPPAPLPDGRGGRKAPPPWGGGVGERGKIAAIPRLFAKMRIAESGVQGPTCARSLPRASLALQAGAARNLTLARLAQRVETVYGAGFLATQSDEALERLRGLQPAAGGGPSGAPSESAFQPAAYSYAERYLDQLEILAALQALARALPLRAGVLLEPAGAEYRLGEAERQGLAVYREKVEDQMLGLFRSRREDFGFPLLLGMARLTALDASIASGRFAFLNLAESTGPSLPGGEATRQAYADSHARFLAAKSALAHTVDEWAYAEAEQAANRFAMAGQALREGLAPNWDMLAAMPEGLAEAALVPTAMGHAQLQSHITQLENADKAYQAELRELYAYDLLNRNCASELFRMADGEDLARTETNSPRWLDFIPFMAFDVVGEDWRVVATEDLPSYRHRRLEQAKAAGDPWLATLRESNIFTSRLYAWHGGDAAFVFFTDEPVWARPLAGGFNLAAGLAQGTVGLFTLPWDQGGNLWQGVKGALVSLPELVFFNIRKGSFPQIQNFAE